MLARCPILLRFFPCIRAFFPQKTVSQAECQHALGGRLKNSRANKDPQGQVRCGSLFLSVRKGMANRADDNPDAAVLQLSDGLVGKFFIFTQGRLFSDGLFYRTNHGFENFWLEAAA
nr:MAG TPA: hypothetical protein [Caudoviricetes sp.]